jgi:hypothetical protein
MYGDGTKGINVSEKGKSLGELLGSLMQVQIFPGFAELS